VIQMSIPPSDVPRTHGPQIQQTSPSLTPCANRSSILETCHPSHGRSCRFRRSAIFCTPEQCGM
jgi:hypothetical protein